MITFFLASGVHRPLHSIAGRPRPLIIKKIIVMRAIINITMSHHQPLFSCVSGALVPRIGNCATRTLCSLHHTGQRRRQVSRRWPLFVTQSNVQKTTRDQVGPTRRRLRLNELLGKLRLTSRSRRSRPTHPTPRRWRYRGTRYFTGKGLKCCTKESEET